jgi:hypothetical protein
VTPARAARPPACRRHPAEAPGDTRRSDLAGWAEYAYCASHSRSWWARRLHLLCTLRGLPTGFALTRTKADERRVLVGPALAAWGRSDACPLRGRYGTGPRGVERWRFSGTYSHLGGGEYSDAAAQCTYGAGRL